MEQLSLGLDISDERKAFEIIYPHLADLIYDAPIDSDVLVFKEIGDLSSVYFLNSNMIFFQIRIRKKTKYLLIPESYISRLPSTTSTCKTKSTEGMIRIAVHSAEDILSYTEVLREILSDITKRYHLFGCCSRYEACSDARKCIHPDIKFALGCKYRQNLMAGKIFYGKNRNID